MSENDIGIRGVRDYWNNRAQLGERAGSNDLLAKQLEINAIAKYVGDGMRVLEVGCGNGVTAIELARRYHVDILGIDFARKMIAAAKASSKQKELKGTLRFETGDIRSSKKSYGKFDLIFTERVLINLPNWESQQQAIMQITNMLADRGLYLMCENSQDGLDMINLFRELVGLPAIAPPWHNRYFRDAEIAQCNFPGVRLEGIDYYSATYYFLSRVVNAWLARREGKEPTYNAPINQIALQLPSIGNFGQGRIWLWRKVDKSKCTHRKLDSIEEGNRC